MPQPAVKPRLPLPVRVIEPLVLVQPGSWEGALAAFLKDTKREGRSAQTLLSYDYFLGKSKRTTTFREDHGITTPAEFTATMFKAFDVELQEIGLEPGSVSQYHRVIKRFLNWCSSEEGSDGQKTYAIDPGVARVKSPKLAQREPECFTDQELAVIRKTLARRPRDLMLFDLMVATGLRIGEATRLTTDDYIETTTEPYLKVRQGKTNAARRSVPMDTPLRKVSPRLVAYMKDRPAGSAIFLSERGVRLHGPRSPLTTAAAQTMFTQLTQDTGIHVHAHRCRHTFATAFLKAGGEPLMLMKLLGHTSPSMTMKYVHYQVEDSLEAFRLRRD